VLGSVSEIFLRPSAANAELTNSLAENLAFSRFRHYTNLSRCEARLRRVLGEFAFTSMYECLQQRGLLAADRATMRQLPPLAPPPLLPGRLPAG